MTIKYTATTLKKLEQLFEEARYRIRYEKGQFHSGYCVLEAKKVAVINRFLDTEGRINALMEIIPSIGFDFSELSGEMQKFYHQLMPTTDTSDEKIQQSELDFGDS